MAVGGSPVANTYGTQDAGTLTPAAVGIREDLTDIFTRIDPAEVPFWSNTPKATAKQTLHEWQVQELDPVDTTGQPEGFETTFDPALPSVRLNNRLQILARSYIVSGTLDVVDKAGRDREMVLQRTLKGLELRRDIESALLANKIKSDTDPRILAGLPTYMVEANSSIGVGGTPVFPTGDGETLVVEGTTELVLTFAIMDAVLESVFNLGGNPSMILLTPNAKRNFSGLNDAGDQLPSQNRFNKNEIADTAFIGSVGVYLSDFGRLDTMVDRFAPGGSALGGAEGYEAMFFIDKRHVQIPNLQGRTFLNVPLAKTGDADKAHMLSELTLRVSGPKAHGMVLAGPIA